jgi:cytochrome P460
MRVTARRLTVRKARLMLSPIAVLAVSFTLSAQTDETPAFPKEFRRWAHVKSVLVGPQSIAFATEGGIHHIYANGKALEGYDSGKFPDGSVIVYDLLETKDVAGNTIEGPTRRVDVMVKQSERDASTGGWKFMSFSGNDQKDGKLTAEREATCAGCHAHRKDHDFVFSEFREWPGLVRSSCDRSRPSFSIWRRRNNR